MQKALTELENALRDADALRGSNTKGTRAYIDDTFKGRALDAELSWYGDLSGLRESLTLENVES